MSELLGCDRFFIAGGIHRDETMRDGALDPAGLEAVLAGSPVKPIAAMAALG
ncbi:hypothetical protein [Bosea sp. (in: a-proteobacteria)]|uniref:hypothetical protein n=1 Tax=Bosea sp. (in: a-proteobacteria) TaxID=1871050 RepID=UPI004034DFBB